MHYYGSECKIPCGHCAGDGLCNNVTGQCSSGCQDHWQGPTCDGRLSLDMVHEQHVSHGDFGKHKLSVHLACRKDHKIRAVL